MADIRGTPGNDYWLIGTPDGDWIEGLSGDDVILPGGRGEWGNTIAPGPGNDYIEGDPGDVFDTLFYGYALDAVDDAGLLLAPSRVDVDLEAGIAQEYAGEVVVSEDHFSNMEGVIGSIAGGDRLDGSAAGNFMKGLGGDDEIDGRSGDDTLLGGDGNDMLRGGSGHDNLYGEAGRDELRGGWGDDRLDGGDEHDLLEGGSGDDTLVGGLGGDHLYGDHFFAGSPAPRGADHFVYGSTSESTWRDGSVPDYIGSFDGAEGDRIDLSAIDADPTLEGDQAFAFIGEDAFSAPGQVRYYHDPIDYGTVVYVNTNDDPSAEMEIMLDGTGGTSAGDFIL